MPRNGQQPPRGSVPYADPEKRREFQRKWRAANREKLRKASLKWRGQYSNAPRVIAFNTAQGWSRDVSEDIAGEVLERAFNADDNLGEDTKRFIDRHIGPGEKRPAAPSVRRAIEVDQVRRKTGS
jgi:hypothetical protein